MPSYQPKGIKKIFHGSRRILAKSWLSLVHPLQIAVTGSQGKTSTSQMLAKILSRFGNTVVTDLNLDTIYNVPITALKTTPRTKYLVWELGVDRPNEMNFHLEIAKPTITIITGISPVHTDYEHLGSLENLIKEKRKLVEALPKKGVAILNYDDKNVRKMTSHTKAEILFYGQNKNCNVFATNIKVALEKTSFLLHDNKKVISITTGLIGSHNVFTLMACYLVVKTLFPNDPKAVAMFKKTVACLKPLRGRVNVEHGPLGTIILNDSLRANPESTLAGLKTLTAIHYQKGRKIAVLGVMGELADPKSAHEATGRQLLQYPPDITICLGDFRRQTYETAVKKGYPKDKIYFAKDVFETADILKKIVKKGDLVYLKGSFLRNLNRILLILDGKKVCCRADLCPYEHCGF